MYNQNCDFPFKNASTFLSVKFLLSRFQRLKEKSQKMGTFALSPHTVVLKYLTARKIRILPLLKTPFILLGFPVIICAEFL